jgi:two-component system response regulator GlrR
MTNMHNPLKKKILIVDDDPHLLRLLGIRLSAAGYNVESAASAKIALGILTSFQPHTVISDLRMEGMDGMALFEQIRKQYPHMPVVIMTAHGTIPDAINATKQGVFSFLTKPFESQELLETVQKSIQLQPSITQNIPKESSWRANIISRSAIMESLLQQTNQVAQSDFSLLIHSASGTGKELLAKAIHQASNRYNNPFTAINCAAIPEQLLESELFGHVKGAFTGAGKNHVGLFQATNGGTLFLDEIGDMPMSFQVKLLRALQEKEIRPVGSTQSIKIDVRIISATHKNLQQAIIDIRQLQNIVEQSVALSTGPLINASLVRSALREKTSQLPSFQEARDQFERDYLANLLKMTAGNVSQAARIAQRNRTEFYKLLNRHHLNAEAFREE